MSCIFCDILKGIWQYHGCSPILQCFPRDKYQQGYDLCNVQQPVVYSVEGVVKP